MLKEGGQDQFYPELMMAILEDRTTELYTTDSIHFDSLNRLCPEGQHPIWDHVKIKHDRRNGSWHGDCWIPNK